MFHSQNFRFAIPETFLVKWKGLFSFSVRTKSFIFSSKPLMAQEANNMDLALLLPSDILDIFDEEILNLSSSGHDLDFVSITTSCCIAGRKLDRGERPDGTEKVEYFRSHPLHPETLQRNRAYHLHFSRLNRNFWLTGKCPRLLKRKRTCLVPGTLHFLGKD